MCCRPEFPTNYRLEIRTIRVIRASSDVLYLYFHPLVERTDLGRDFCLHECEATVSTANFETHVEDRKKNFYSKNSKVTLKGSRNTGTRLGQTRKGIFFELTPWCLRI